MSDERDLVPSEETSLVARRGSLARRVLSDLAVRPKRIGLYRAGNTGRFIEYHLNRGINILDGAIITMRDRTVVGGIHPVSEVDYSCVDLVATSDADTIAACYAQGVPALFLHHHSPLVCFDKRSGSDRLRRLGQAWNRGATMTAPPIWNDDELVALVVETFRVALAMCHSSSPVAGERLVLWPEDDDRRSDVIQRTLQQGPFESMAIRLLVPRDTAEALAMASEHAGRLDLIVSGRRSPKLDGPGFFHQIASSIQGDVPLLIDQSGNPELDGWELLGPKTMARVQGLVCMPGRIEEIHEQVVRGFRIRDAMMEVRRSSLETR